MMKKERSGQRQQVFASEKRASIRYLAIPPGIDTLNLLARIDLSPMTLPLCALT
jgi:hypothetical protein